MSAQINLLNRELRPRARGLAARHVAVALGVSLIAMAALQGVLVRDLAHRRAEVAFEQSEHAARLARMAALKQAAPAASQSAIAVDIQRLEAELRAQQDGLAALADGAVGEREGYARYLRAFSRGAVNGLWLTGFIIAGSGDITLRGRLMRPELLPEYIGRLTAEAAMKGRAFATLDLRQAQSSADISSTADPGARSYLEFTLASADVKSAAPAPGGARAP